MTRLACLVLATLTANAAALTETHRAEGPGTHPLTVIDTQHAEADRMRLVGEVRTVGVEQIGTTPETTPHLVAWHHFGADAYFTRGLLETGPMRNLAGDQGWRRFELPFDASMAAVPLDRIELFAVLPGEGVVEVRGVAFEPLAASAAVATNAWWSPRTGGWIGAIFGSSVGLMGGLLGVLMWLKAGRGPVLTVLAIMVTACFGSLLTGLIALANAQPYAVWYPLVLIGIIGTAVPLANYIPIRRRLEQMEMQKLRAMDA